MARNTAEQEDVVDIEELIKELTALQKKIDNAKVEVAKVDGLIADREARLKALKFNDVADAEKHLADLQDEIAKLEDGVRRGVDEVREKYGL